MISGSLPVIRPRIGAAARGVYQEDSSSVLVALHGLEQTHLAQYSHPGLDRAGTNLSYCNGEIRVASSNITLYVVWAGIRPRCIAHTWQHQVIFRRGDEDRRWENRESLLSLAQALEKCNGLLLAVATCKFKKNTILSNGRRNRAGEKLDDDGDATLSGPNAPASGLRASAVRSGPNPVFRPCIRFNSAVTVFNAICMCSVDQRLAMPR